MKQNQFFEINKIDKSLARMIKGEKRDKTQIICPKYQEPRWNRPSPWKTWAPNIQSRRNNVNSILFIKEINWIFKNLSTKKTLGPYCFIGKLCQTCKEEIIPIIYQLLNKIKEEKVLPNSFYEASITPIEKIRQSHYK